MLCVCRHPHLQGESSLMVRIAHSLASTLFFVRSSVDVHKPSKHRRGVDSHHLRRFSVMKGFK